MIIAAAPARTEGAKADGDTRTIYLHHAHTHESIEATFLVDGRYDPAVLDKLNWFLRDWRRDEQIHMDPRLFDTIWEVYRESGSRQPIEVMSAYRSPETNAMLRRRSRAVAEHSQHILGKAMDQHYVDVPMSRIREIAMKLQRGGVGFYPTAGTPFVHMDVGGVRHWPRMSYDQLARLFPDGKTVHIPSNGQPLPGYELARAELEARGDSFAYPTATEVKSKGFFAWLFGGSDEDEDTAASDGRSGGRRGQTRVASLDRGSTGSVPLPSNSFVGMSGKDGGAHSFMLAEGESRGVTEAPGSRRSAGDQRVAALEPARQSAPSQSDEARAQQSLAAALAEQKQQAAAAAEAGATQAALDQTKLTQDAPAGANASGANASGANASGANASGANAAALGAAAPPAVAVLGAPAPLAGAPMPPHRPVELASDGPEAPLPPGRPPEFARSGANSDRAPGVPAPARQDGIGSLIASAAGLRTAGLPAAITVGTKASTPPQVLAYAAPAAGLGMAASLGRVAVPVPVARPSFVAARLDRSNFRTLTGSGTAIKAPMRSGIGSAVTALRPAAQSNLGMMQGASLSGATVGFNAHATDLPSDHFAGPAVKSHEHVVTSTAANVAGAHASAD